VETEVSFV